MTDLLANAGAHLDALAFRALAATGARALAVAVTGRDGPLRERAYGFAGAAGAPPTPARAGDCGFVPPADLAALARPLLAGGPPPALATLRAQVLAAWPGAWSDLPGLELGAGDGVALGLAAVGPGTSAIVLVAQARGVAVAAAATADADLGPFAADVLRTYAAAVAGRPLPEMPPLGAWP